MYQVTELYKEKIKENVRTFKISIEIQHSAGTLTLSDENIVSGSLRLNESSQVGNDFTIGGVSASTLEFELIRKAEYSEIEFEGATIIPQVGLLLSSSVDTENYFINAPQPSEFEDSQIQEQWEFVPLGRFNIDEAIKSRNLIRIKAIDNMIELDKPYSLSKLSYPASLYQIYMNICSVADVQPGTTSFINQDYIVDERPEGDYTLRDILSYVAALSGNFARFNRVGSLELTWYEDVGLTLTGANRFDFKPREDLIQIKGVAYTTTNENGEEVTYLAGSDEYVVDLTNNPLLQKDFQTVISNIYEKVKTTVFTPYESRWQGNPAIQTGDKIIQIDRDGNEFETIVTHSTYKYRGASILAARGLPVKAKGYKGSTNKKIAEVRRVLEDNFNRQINEMQEVIKDGMVVTYYQEEQPAGKLGDLWYDTTNELLKRYNGTQWALITDKRIVEAIEKAQNAQDTADGKIVSYYQEEQPINASSGDLWIDVNDNNKLYRFDGEDWIDVHDKNIDKVATDLSSAISNVNQNISDMQQAIEDEMIVTYYQETEPSAKLGDLWFNTTTKKLYRHNGITFDLIEDIDITTAIEKAQNAQDTADGKIVSYYQEEMPSEGTIGDLWIDTNDNNKLYRYNGTTYVSVQDKNIDKLATDLNNAITDVNTDISTLEQSVLNATEMIANMLGGYAFYEADGFYVADNPVLANAQKVWKWGIGGFGYSENGVEGPYTTAISADGTIVAMLVAANIITADMVKTGILSSEDDSTWINLDDGSFNFKNVLKYENGKLVINDLNYVQTGVSYKGTTIDLQRGIYVEFTDGGHAQIGDGSILVQHVDGSHTVIDGRGIMRLFSIPIFEDVPSDTDIIDNFETGLIADTRVDLSRSEMYGIDTLEELITVTNADKYAGVYSLKVQSPKESVVITGQHWVKIGDTGFWAYEGYYYSYVRCEFLNYKPTKDTTLSFKYKTYNSLPTKFSINLYVDDLDYPEIPTEVYPLSSTSWSSMDVLLTANHTYKVWVRISGSSDFEDGNLLKNKQAYVYIDDMSWELDVNESVIVGYEEGTKPYNDFTYIRKDEIPTGTTQKQVMLPDYFRGMNFDVLITQLENYATPSLLSINNKIPSFTVSGENTKFMYTVVLNN